MKMRKEPILDTAQLAHTELYTPDMEGTLWFFKALLGMQETERKGKSVYLRAYEDYYHHTLKVTEGKEPGMGHTAWRATSPQALERRVKALEKSGLGKGWNKGDLGHGPAYEFETPDGHKMEIFWEVEYFKPAKDQVSKLRNRPQKRPTTGLPVRRIDHVNLLASDVTKNKQFMMNDLGFKLREYVELDGGEDAAAWLSVSPLVHELAFMNDEAGSKGRLHHVCYWYGYPENIMEIADVFRDNGIEIEAGPLKHGVSQAWIIYVFEPGGNRVELFGDSGYLIFDPDWKPVKWTEDEIETAIIWYGDSLPADYFQYGTPIIKK